MASLPGEIVAAIGEHLSLQDIGNFMCCNTHLFNVFAPGYWKQLNVDSSNVDRLLYLLKLIDSGKSFDVVGQYVERVEMVGTGEERPITPAEQSFILDHTNDLKRLRLTTQPLKSDKLKKSLRKLKHAEVDLHVMCDEMEPGDFSKLDNIKSLVLENVYEGIDHLIPLPESVQFLDIRAHSTCAYSRVLGKFMSNCTKMPTLRISELSIGIDRSTAWIPASTTRLELFDCQIHVSNTVEQQPVMNGIKTLKICDDYSKIDKNTCLPDLETLELCKQTAFITSLNANNAPNLKHVVFHEKVSGPAVMNALHNGDRTVMSQLESLHLTVNRPELLEELVTTLNGYPLHNVTLDVSPVKVSKESAADYMAVLSRLHASLTLQSSNYEHLLQFSDNVLEQNGVYRAACV